MVNLPFTILQIQIKVSPDDDPYSRNLHTFHDIIYEIHVYTVKILGLYLDHPMHATKPTQNTCKILGLYLQGSQIQQEYLIKKFLKEN